MRYALFDNDVSTLRITENENMALLDYRQALFKRRVAVLDVSSVFVSPDRLLNAYRLEWNPTAFPAAGEKKQQSLARPDLGYVAQTVEGARGRRCGFKFFMQKVKQRLLLSQREVERAVALFGPAQEYFSDEFLFVKSYLRPVDARAFVSYCERVVGLKFREKEVETALEEETHKTKSQK